MHSPRSRVLAVGFILAVALFGPGLEVLALHVPLRSAQGPTVLINEVQYDPPGGPAEAGHEWVELYNAGSVAVVLAGWQLADNKGAEDLGAAGRLEPGAFLIVAGGDGFAADHPGFEGRVLVLGGAIGNGLGNSGDRLRLQDGGGQLRDAMSYGDDAMALDPPAPDVVGGHSLERAPAGADTDRSTDWVDQAQPSPGQEGGTGQATAMPSPDPLPSLPPGVAIRLNEFLAAPKAVDWDGDGKVGQDDEWIELFNPGDQPAYLRGWQLDDAPGGGSAPFVFPDGSVIGPRGHLLIFQGQSGVALNNDADAVRLLNPDGRELDREDYQKARSDQSLARWPDGEGAWTDALAPSPGSANGAGGVTPPAPTAVGATPPATVAPPSPTSDDPPGAVDPTAGPTLTAAATMNAWPPTVGTASPTPAGLLLPLLISEVLFDPAISGNDMTEEWAELHNPGTVAVSLAGWQIGDREEEDPLPAVHIAPGGFLVIAAAASEAQRLAARGISVVALADGSLGGGLGNGGDLLRLRDPTGNEGDAVSYGDNLDAFDPAVPLGPPGASIERVPAGTDSDSAEDWWIQDLPSPGAAGSVAQGPPLLLLSEVLPAPLAMDWNGNGQADHEDEWIEIYNPGDRPVGLSGWSVEDRPAAGWSYRFDAEARIGAGAYLLLPRARSGIALQRDADTVRLIRPDGMEADRAAWESNPGFDRSVCRPSVAPAEPWRLPCDPSPGGPNRLADRSETDDDLPSARPTATGSTDGAAAAWPLVPLAELRTLSDSTRVTAEGRVTAPPGVFDARAFYLGDDEAGIRVYLSARDDRLPGLAEGDVVRLRGRLGEHDGERELRLARAADLRRLGEGRPVSPVDLATGSLGEPVEGRLLRLAGWAARPGRYGFALDDGSGEASIYLDPTAGIQLPDALKAAPLTVVGIVGQRAGGAAMGSGHRLMPRYPRDIAAAAARLQDWPGLPGTGRR